MFNPSYIDIRVDGNRTRTFFERDASILPRLGVSHSANGIDESLYIGGIPQHLHQKDSIRRLLSFHIFDGKGILGGAFPGCIKQIKVNHRWVSLASISKSVLMTFHREL